VSAGEFHDQAARNLQALIDLIRHQQVAYDFGCQQVLMKSHITVISVSKNKPILPVD